MKNSSEIRLQYRYPGYPWKEYDRTRVVSWENSQFKRMTEEYPGAEYRRITKDGKLKTRQP